MYVYKLHRSNTGKIFKIQTNNEERTLPLIGPENGIIFHGSEGKNQFQICLKEHPVFAFRTVRMKDDTIQG
jgi:hypothetical protein